MKTMIAKYAGRCSACGEEIHKGDTINLEAMKYDIHYFKSQNLTPDERNAMRRNQRGVWLMSGIRTENRKYGLALARHDYPNAEKFRAVPTI